MNINYNRWRKLFQFCLGLSVASALSMKLMEFDFWVNNEKFTIIGLELFYPKEKVIAILSHLDDGVKTTLNYHLYIDFVFMAGIYPVISAMCMMAREKISSLSLKKIL